MHDTGMDNLFHLPRQAASAFTSLRSETNTPEVGAKALVEEALGVLDLGVN